MRFALLTILVLTTIVRADEGKTLTPFLDERTIAVMRLDLKQIEVTKLIERLATVGKLKPTSLAKETKEWATFLERMVKEGASVVYILYSLADDEPFLVVPLTKEASVPNLTKRLAILKQFDPSYRVVKRESSLIAGSGQVIKRVQTLKPIARPDILEGLGKDAPAARLLLVPTTDTRKILEETLPMLPEELGGGPITPLSRGFRTLLFDVEAAPKIQGRVTIQASDEEAAKELERIVPRLLKGLADSEAIKHFVPSFAKLTALWKPKREKDRLVVMLEEATLAEVVKPYLEQFIVSEQQARSTTQMRKIITAMHAHEAKHGVFPAHASHTKDGKPLLSWRVHLLPFVGEEKLYKEFKLDKPWDSAHNKKLVAKMPAVYRAPNATLAANNLTTFLVPRGENMMFPDRRGVRIVEVNDGTSHTIALVDAEDKYAVEWTKPDDLKIDQKDTRKNLGLAPRYGGQYLVAFADGFVRTLPGTMATSTLWALLTRNQGEVVEWP